MANPALLHKFFRPLYTQEGQGILGALGTATLVRGDNAHYLITCSHCLLNAERRSVLLACGQRIWPIEKFPLVLSTEGGSDDKVDLSIYMIPENLFPLFSSSCSFFHLKDLQAHTKKPDVFTICAGGFPLNWNRRHLKVGATGNESKPRSQSFHAGLFSTET